MATYNGARFLKEQLASIAGQRRPPNELLVFDDGSTDSTVPQLLEFARGAAFPVRIEQNANQLGYGENFLRGALKAQTTLVAFADQDDVWDADKLVCASAPFENPNVMMSTHQVDLIDEQDAAMGHFAQGIYRTESRAPLTLEPWGLFLGFTMTFRRKLLDVVPVEQRGPDSHDPRHLAAHDRWVYTLSNACGETAVIARPLARYRQHQQNLFGKRKVSRLQRMKLPLSHIAGMGEAYASIAEHRAVVLERAAENEINVDLRQRLAAAADLWLRLSDQAGRRVGVYQEPARLKRLARLVGNLRSSVYVAPTSRRFMLSAFLRDATTIVK